MTTNGPIEPAELDRLFEVSDEAAKHALAHYDNDEWLDVAFAQIMLSAARSLRAAGRDPSPAVVEAMERCAEMHRAWADVWRREQEVDAADAHPEPELEDEPDADAPIRIKVGLGELVRGVLKVAKP